MSHYPQSPLSIGKVLDRGFSLYRQAFKAVLPLSIVVAIMAQLPQLLPLAAGEQAPPPSILVGLAIAFVIWLGAYIACYNGLIRSIDSVASGGAALRLGQAIRSGGARVLAVLGASILFFLAIAIGSVLLLVPGLILMLSLSFFWMLIVLEDQKPLTALKASHRLVWGNWWRTLVVVSVAMFVYGVIVVLFTTLFGAVAGFSAAGGAQVAPAHVMVGMFAVQAVASALLMPMLVAVLLVQFRDLQLRKSGSDLLARAEAA